MTTTYLPPIGSVWVNKKNPHDIAIVRGYNTVAPIGNKRMKNNVVKIHKVNTNTTTIEITNTFTWVYKPLTQGE